MTRRELLNTPHGIYEEIQAAKQGGSVDIKYEYGRNPDQNPFGPLMLGPLVSTFVTVRVAVGRTFRSAKWMIRVGKDAELLEC